MAVIGSPDRQPEPSLLGEKQPPRLSYTLPACYYPGHDPRSRHHRSLPSGVGGAAEPDTEEGA